MGKNGPGTRGVRPEGPFEPPTPLAGHMPAKSPREQSDIGPSGERGKHDDGTDYGPTKMPKECYPDVDDSGTNVIQGRADRAITMGSQDPRRSHS